MNIARSPAIPHRSWKPKGPFQENRVSGHSSLKPRGIALASSHLNSILRPLELSLSQTNFSLKTLAMVGRNRVPLEMMPILAQMWLFPYVSEHFPFSPTSLVTLPVAVTTVSNKLSNLRRACFAS